LPRLNTRTVINYAKPIIYIYIYIYNPIYGLGRPQYFSILSQPDKNPYIFNIKSPMISKLS